MLKLGRYPPPKKSSRATLNIFLSSIRCHLSFREFKVRHRWVVLRYKGQYFFLHSCIILESFVSVREFYFRECFVCKVVRVASRSKA